MSSSRVAVPVKLDIVNTRSICNKTEILITCRKYKAIDKPTFWSDIASSLPTAISSGKQTELGNHYNVVLSKLIEKHAPQQTCRIAERPLVPWYNKKVIKAKQIRRQCERKWRHTSLQVHREIYKTQCAEVKRTIIKTMSDYYTSEIEKCRCDNRRLHRLLNGLLQRGKSHYLPVNNNINELASRLSTFFSGKIETIRVAFQSRSTLTSSWTTDHHPAPWVSRLKLFPTATTSDIHSLLIKSPTTSCVLDPLPTWLLKDVSDNVVPFLTKLINSSIASGVVPCCLKHANVTLMLKKANIDQDSMNSYRQISNLPFVSKLLERYVARCLLDHITANNLLERYQSAYKSHNSTETALVLVQNDILGEFDWRYGVILILLDMSAAFDTVNHEILLSLLEHRYGMASSVLAWMRLYLTDRSQCVCLQGGASSKPGVACSVPQGSVLGPLLFSAYTDPIGDIIRRHNLGFHLYTDAIHQIFEMTEINRLLSLRRIEQCLNDVRAWMGDNQLKVNGDKTVALVLSSHNNRPNHNVTVIKIGDCDITPSPTGRNIGVIFNTEMSMVSHVKHFCCTSYYHLRNIASIRS